MPEFDSLKSPTCSLGGRGGGGVSRRLGGNTEVADNNGAAFGETRKLPAEGRKDADSGNFHP